MRGVPGTDWGRFGKSGRTQVEVDGFLRRSEASRSTRRRATEVRRPHSARQKRRRMSAVGVDTVIPWPRIRINNGRGCASMFWDKFNWLLAPFETVPGGTLEREYGVVDASPIFTFSSVFRATI